MPISFCVKASTDKNYAIEMDSNDTVGDIKREISRRTGLPWAGQHLVFRERLLINSCSLSSCGIVDGSVVNLVILTKTATSVLLRSSVKSCWNASSVPMMLVETGMSQVVRENCTMTKVEKDVTESTFGKDKEADNRYRVRENLKTMQKVRALRMEMEKIRLQKLNRKPQLVFLNSGSAGDQTICGACETPARLVSAEDTSTKESSANETERDDNDTRGANNLASTSSCKIGPKECRAKAAASISSCGRNVFANALESDAQCWPATYGDKSFDSLQRQDGSLKLLCRSKIQPTDDATSNPSDFSSDMAIYQAYKKCKGKRRINPARITSRRGYMPISSGQANNTAVFQSTCELPKRLISECPRPSGRQVAKSKQRECSSPIESTTCDSSSDEKDLFTSDRIAQAIGLMLEKKTNGYHTRRLAYADASVPSGNPLRGRKQPQSSQSQQRCLICGYRLSQSVGFQCHRCGKTLCTRHRVPSAHACFYHRLQSQVISIDEADASSDSIPEHIL